MPYNFVFTNRAKKEFFKFDVHVQKQIIKKITTLKKPDALKAQIKPIKQLEPATHRVRLGNYRALVQFKETDTSIIILKIGHRREIYK